MSWSGWQGNNVGTQNCRNGRGMPLLVVDVNNLKNGRKPVKIHKESPAGCARQGKERKGNQEKRKGRFNDQPTTAFCEEESVSSRQCELKEKVFEVCLGQRVGSSYGEGIQLSEMVPKNLNIEWVLNLQDIFWNYFFACDRLVPN